MILRIPSLIAVTVLFVGLPMRAQTISLAGSWRFQLDREEVGISERWFDRKLTHQIKLPGCLSQQGIGDPVTADTKWTGGIVDKSWFTAPEYAPYRQLGNVKIPFWLQPERYYVGAAWFQRVIQVPASWRGRRTVLLLERAHWETRVWVDGQIVGTNRSLSTPHEYDLGQLSPGRHTLTIRVDNRRIVDIGENSHAISDHTQGNWNGIVGRIELRSAALVWIEDLQVYPDKETGRLRVRLSTGNATGRAVGVTFLSSLAGHIVPDLPPFPQQSSRAELPPGQTNLDLTYPLGDQTSYCESWDEFAPRLYSFGVRLEVNSDPTTSDQKSVVFGFRKITTQGTQFKINDRTAFIRGTLECAIFPKTGHPPTDLAEWRRLITVAKSFGLNLLRFHSYCPPEAAFDAADELGMYLQVETCWANQSTSLGDGKPVDDWVYAETDRILKYYGNHPSFLLMPYGNEPGGRKANAWLTGYVAHFRAIDPRRLWTSGAGWPQLPGNQFHVTPDPRVQAWGAGLKSRINASTPETTTDYRDYVTRRSVPVISHEIGQWCVYPNFREIPKYTGYLKPQNFEIFHDRLRANGLRNLAHDFLLASGKLQALCYKEDIESALRTPGMGGFELLDLHDFPGQGTALVGVLDPFWEEKGYVTADQYHRFCSAVVPLARLPKRVFANADQLQADLEIANYGPQSLLGATVTWKLEGSRQQAGSSGRFSPRDLTTGGNTALGKISVALDQIHVPTHTKLVVGIAGTRIENDWDVWVYPSTPGIETDEVLVTSQFDERARLRLEAGGKVLLTIPGSQVRNFDAAPVKLGFSSIFWNTAWTGRQAPTTLGILCNPRHPALAEFPTESHSDWQWWYLIHRAGALRLDLLPPSTQPIVRVIDDWVTARSLGLVVEGRVGAGKLVICGFDLTHEADDPVSQQMRTSLVHYLSSKRCQPATRFSVAQIQSLVAPAGTALGGGIKSIHADSEQGGYEAKQAVDGNPETLWHTAWGELAPGFPHELVVELLGPRELGGIRLLPRQDRNRNGWIQDYEMYASMDGQNWGTPCAKGKLTAGSVAQEVRFSTPVIAGFWKLRALSGHSDGPWASLAELEFLPHKN